jgi:hypothetical protein
MMTIVFEVDGYCVDAIPMSPITPGSGECPDASYTVEYADGTLIESGTIPSGGSKTVTVPDCPTCDSATWTLKDTAGNILNTGTIASGGSADIVAPDGDITLNSIAMTSVESGGTENILILQSNDMTQVGAKQGTHWRISDSNVSNSTLTYSVDVKAEDDLSLPDEDIIVTDEADNVLQTITNPVYDNLTIELTSFCPTPIGATLMKTGQTTSYRTGDDGDLEAGRATDFFTLATNNPFGNTNRFTDELGGSTYANDIVIDWSTYDNIAGTVLGYYCTGSFISIEVWNDAVDNALTHTVGSYTTGWRLPNRKEIDNISNDGVAGGNKLNYAPFNLSSNLNFWTSTTSERNTATAYIFANLQSYTFFEYSKASTRAVYFYTRTFTVTGTTLT